MLTNEESGTGSWAVKQFQVRSDLANVERAAMKKWSKATLTIETRGIYKYMHTYTHTYTDNEDSKCSTCPTSNTTVSLR